MTTVDTWDPNQNKDPKDTSINLDVLLRLAKISGHDQLDQLAQSLSSDEISSHRHLMTHHKEDWLNVSGELEHHTLVHLIRFFTLAEAQLPGGRSGTVQGVYDPKRPDCPPG